MGPLDFDISDITRISKQMGIKLALLKSQLLLNCAHPFSDSRECEDMYVTTVQVSNRI